MKKFSVIFSILAVALLAIVMMGCPVAYTVGSPYTASPAATLSAAGNNYTLDYDAAVTSYLGTAAPAVTKITLGYNVTSAGNWNLGLTSTISGAGLPASSNFASTKQPNAAAGSNNWWNVGTGGYLILGGTYAGATAGGLYTVTGGTAVDVSYGGGLKWSFVAVVTPVGTAPLVITTTWVDAGSIGIDTVKVEF